MANWYYMAFILVVAVLHIVNNLAVPVSLGHAKSYSAFSGVQDAMTQWWYGHNAVAFFLTAGFLGMMYYYLPKRAGRPIFSYRLSIISFWGITFFYMWAGSHHLHYTALPQWVQTLGMTFSVMLLVPSWASAAQCAADAQRRLGQGARRRDAALHDGRGGVLRPVDLRGIVHGDPRGQFAVALHRLDGRPRPCRRARLGRDDHLRLDLCVGALALEARAACIRRRLVEVHFWLAVAGTIIYVFAMWNSGIIQGLMWRTYNESGTLAYSFIDSLVAMHPYYIARAIGGLLFLIGAIVGCYNIWMTIRTAPRTAGEASRSAPIPCSPARPRSSRRSDARCSDCTTGWNARRSASCSRSSSSPASAASSRSRRCSPSTQTVEDAPDMRVYTPLELAGRNIYIREGCYACHSQMIRTLRDEVERYGPYSLAVESKYDHPMLWGSKRTGPDLARIGGKYSDEWHVAHLNNPRDVVPESIMPAYRWLLRTRCGTMTSACSSRRCARSACPTQTT